MRELKKREIDKRGCAFCEDNIPPTKRFENRKCPHEDCPYHELDNVKTYGEYLKKAGSINISKLLKLQGRRE